MTMTTRTVSHKHRVGEHVLPNSATIHYSLMQTSRESTQHSNWTSNVTFQVKETPLIQATTESGEVKSTTINQNTETSFRSVLSMNSMLSTMRTSKRSVTALPAAIVNSAFFRKSETQGETLETLGISLKVVGQSLETAANSAVVTTKAKAVTATEPQTVNTATATAAAVTTSSSSSSSSSSTTTTITTTEAILRSASTSAVVQNKSSLHIKSHSMLMHVTETNAYTFPTEGLNIASRVSKRSQSIPAPSSPPGGLTETTGKDYTYFGSFQRTRTIASYFQTKKSQKYLFVSPKISHVSTIQMPLQGTLSSTGHFPTLKGSYNVFSSHHPVKETKAISHSTTKIGFSTSLYVISRAERNTSYSKLNTYKTLNVTETLKMPYGSTEKLTPTAQNKTALNQIKSSSMISKPSNVPSVPATSVEVSLISTTKELSSSNSQKKTSSLLGSSASSETFKTVPSASPVKNCTRDVFKLQSSLSSVWFLRSRLQTTVNSTVIKTKTQAATASQRNTSHNILDTYKPFYVTKTFKMRYSSTKALTSVALSRSSITEMLSHTLQYKTALSQMLSSFMISKPLNVPSIPTTTISSEVHDSRTSGMVSHSSTVIEFPASKVQNKTAAIHENASSTISSASIAFSTVDILRRSVEGSQNSTFVLSSSPVVKNKTSLIQATVSSNSSIAFSTADILRTRVEGSQNSTVKVSSSPVVKNKTPIIQAMVSSNIFKSTSTSILTNVKLSLVQNKTSVINVIRTSASFKTLAFFSGTDNIRTSVVVSHHRPILRSSFSMAQNKTLSTPMLAVSKVINDTRTSVANSYSSTITVSSLPLVQSETSAITFYGVNKTTVAFSKDRYPKSSAVVSLNGTIMSSLSTVHKYTSLVHVHLNPTVISSKKTTIEPPGEWIRTTNIITISSVLMTRSLFSSSKASKQNASFASSSLIEVTSNILSRTQYMTPTTTATSSLIVINPSHTLTVQATLSNASFSKSIPLRRPSGYSSSLLKSLESTILSISSPFEFVASTSDSNNFVSATPWPSHVMSSVLKVKSSSPYYASRVSEDSTSQFLKRVSTFISKEIILNSTLFIDNTNTPLLTTVSVESSQALTSKLKKP